MTRSGVLVGTPGYIAPEVLHGCSADTASDQFSFCVTLYEALFRERPFRSPPRSPAVVESGGAQPPPARTPSDVRGIPRWLQQTVQRGLSWRPEDRYPSMDGLLAALNREPIRRRRMQVALGLAMVFVGGIAVSLLATRAPEQDTSTERAELRNDQPMRARLLATMGSVATQERRVERAIELRCEVLAIHRRLLPAISEEVANAEESLGIASRDKTRRDEARLHYVEALAIQRRLFGDEHPLIANVHPNLGVTYLDDANATQARKHLLAALAILERMPTSRGRIRRVSLGDAEITQMVGLACDVVGDLVAATEGDDVSR